MVQVCSELVCVDSLLQGAGAGQLRSMEEKVLVPLQDERQRWDGRAGPLRVPRVCQEGRSHSCSHNYNTPKSANIEIGPKTRVTLCFCQSSHSLSEFTISLPHLQELKGGKAYAKVSFTSC